MESNRYFSTPEKTHYLKSVFSLLLFLPLIGIEILFIILPKLFENLLYARRIDLFLENNAILVPFLFVSLIYGMLRIKNYVKEKLSPKHAKYIIPIVMFLLFTNYMIIFNNTKLLTVRFYKKRGLDLGCEESLDYNKRWKYLMELEREIPKSSGVLVDMSLSLPFAERRYVYKVPGNLSHILKDDKIDYILFNIEVINCLKNSTKPFTLDAALARYEIEPLLNEFGWEKIEEKDGFVLFKRIY